MVKTRKDSRIEIWADRYINDTGNCRNETDKNVDIVQIECGAGGRPDYMVEVVDKKDPEEEEKSRKEANDLIFATGKLSAMTIIVNRLKEECDNPNRNWYGSAIYSEIRDVLCDIEMEFKNEVDKRVCQSVAGETVSE